MFVAKVPNRTSPPCYLLRENKRVDGKVKTTTLANLTHLPLNQIEAISAVLKGQSLAPIESLFTIARSYPHGHVAAVMGTLRKLGLDTLIDPEPSAHRNAVLAMIALRVLSPHSKLAMTRALDDETTSSSLGTVLELGSIDDNELYRAMDWLSPRQEKIEAALAKRHLSDGALVLYDITSVYFEGDTCPLATYGYNRDGKSGTRQIVVGLICTADGCPVSVQVFKGNTQDASTVRGQIETVKSKFGLTRVIVVGDRGMITGKLIQECGTGDDPISYVTALRSSGIQKLVKSGAVDRELFDEENCAEITSDEFPGERLVVCLNPYLRDERRANRKNLLASAEKKLGVIRDATLNAQAIADEER